MRSYLCVTCAVQQPPGEVPPKHCPICEDERQYVRQGGQAWTTIEELRLMGHRIELRELEPGLVGVGVTPTLGIGQRALLVRTTNGNILWDCVGYIDDDAVAEVRARGGISGIAFSHPHFYGSMVEWSRAFGGAPIYIPLADREWVQRDDPAIVTWRGTRELSPGVTLVQCGGHFEGSAVLHWAGGAGGKGVLFSADQPQVCMDRRWVTFLYSYPNMIPLGAPAVRRIVNDLRPFPFERVYGGFQGKVVSRDGKGAVERSAERYLRSIGA